MPDRYSSLQKTAHFIEGFANAKDRGAKPQSIQYFDQYMYHLKNAVAAQEMNEALSEYYQDLMAYYDLCKKAGEAYGTATKEERERLLTEASAKADTITEHINKTGFYTHPEKVEAAKAKNDQSPNLCSLYEGFWVKNTVFRGESVLAGAGASKSAAKWIDGFKKEIKKGQPVSEDTAAKILASRQLANAILGKRKNIDDKKLTQAEIDAQVYKLKNSSEFKEFVKQNQPFDAALLADGHGGKFEKTFENFLVKTRPENEMDFDAHGRYRARINDNIKATADFEVLDNPFRKKEEPKKEPEWAPGKEGSPKYQYKTYREYFNLNKTNLDGTVTPEYHAAKMAAADHLSRKDPDAPFDEKELKKKATEWMKNPEFKIVCKVPGAMDMISKGDVEGFSKEVDAIKYSSEAMLDDKGTFDPKGYSYLSRDRLEEYLENNDDKDLKNVIDKYNALHDGMGNHDAKEVRDVINAITDYQDKYAHVTDSKTEENVNDTVKLLYEMTAERSIGSIVQTQIDKINKRRGIQKGENGYLTKDIISAEGKEEAEMIKKAVVNGDIFKDEQDLNKSADSKKSDVKKVNEELNKSFNFGNGLNI